MSVMELKKVIEAVTADMNTNLQKISDELNSTASSTTGAALQIRADLEEKFKELEKKVGTLSSADKDGNSGRSRNFSKRKPPNAFGPGGRRAERPDGQSGHSIFRGSSPIYMIPLKSFSPGVFNRTARLQLDC